MARRFRRWPGFATTLTAIVLVAAMLRAGLPARRNSPNPTPLSSTAGSRVLLAAGPCEIVGIVDGNTLLVRQGQHLFDVRLLGVALPAGTDQQLARADLARIAPPGSAWIELDKRRAAADGSWLAYVYVDDTLVNAKQIAAGFTAYDMYPGDSSPFGRQLREAQSEAQRTQRGIWQASH